MLSHLLKSISFHFTADTLGVGHPPGYPLFAMMGKFSIEFIELIGGSHTSRVSFLHLFLSLSLYLSLLLVQAWRVNLMNAVVAATSGMLIFLAACRLTCYHVAVSTVVWGIYSFSPLMWQYSVTAEVFALNNFFTVVLFCVCILFAEGMSLKKSGEL